MRTRIYSYWKSFSYFNGKFYLQKIYAVGKYDEKQGRFMVMKFPFGLSFEQALELAKIIGE